jgi:16S rRNA (cytidine1402-2'-O)-methyltransferase
MNNAKHSGVLYVVATPIGNMEDITLRAIRILGQVDLVAAEDTRHTAKLLAHHKIRRHLVSYHEHNERERTPGLIQKLVTGAAVALVSNAGTPSVSDPGYILVHEALAKGIRVVPIPGASAATTALCASGLPTDRFYFFGFPPPKKGKRREKLQKIAEIPGTIIFYESPKRIKALIRELIDILGDRCAVLAREMTKLHEEFIRGSLSKILRELNERHEVKGECTLLLEGFDKQDADPFEMIGADIAQALQNREESLSNLSKRLAKKYGVSRSQIYAEALRIRKD